MSGKKETAKAPLAKTTAAKPKAPPKPPAFTMVMDETGAMRRVAVAPVKPAPAPAPAPTATGPMQPVRTAITTAAVQQTALPQPQKAPQPVPSSQLVFENENDYENNDYDNNDYENSEEELVFDAPKQPEEKEENEDDELVFNATGQLTGEARAKALAAIKEKEEKEEKKAAEPRKPSKAEKTMENAGSEVEKMKLFYRYRSKNPIYFQYTNEGNLEVKANNPLKVPPMVIPLRAFGPLKPEELEEIERKQKEVQDDIEEQYVVKLKELRAVNDAYSPNIPASVAAVVKANQELRDLSILRNAALYPERWTKELESVEIRRILLNQTHEDRKFEYPIYLFKRYSLSRQDVEGHYREHGEGTDIQEGGGTLVLFITDPDDQKTGIFHPANEHDFVYNETKYASPYQAFQTERFKQLEDDSMVEKLLGTRSAKTIKNLVDKEPRQVQHALKLWEEILEALCTQYKDAGDRLKETGSARFHMMDKVIGTPEYAMALSNVRTKLKERESDAPNNVDAIKQSVITKEQQQKDKVGAIINNFRRFG